MRNLLERTLDNISNSFRILPIEWSTIRCLENYNLFEWKSLFLIDKELKSFVICICFIFYSDPLLPCKMYLRNLQVHAHLHVYFIPVNYTLKQLVNASVTVRTTQNSNAVHDIKKNTLSGTKYSNRMRLANSATKINAPRCRKLNHGTLVG